MEKLNPADLPYFELYTEAFFQLLDVELIDSGAGIPYSLVQGIFIICKHYSWNWIKWECGN